MTLLNKTIKRESKAVYRGRPLILQIEPPSIIKIKEKGRKTWYETTIEAVFTFAAKQYAEKVRQERIKARKIKRLEKEV